jgi:beta-glucosidase
MPFGVYMNEKTLVPAVKEGKVKESDIDDKIRRLLRIGYRFGWMDNDPLDESISRYNQQGRQAALQGAREGIVLLKNGDSLLPIDPAKVRTIAVIGPGAFPAVPTAGGSGLVPTFGDVSALKGISDRLGINANVLYDRGVPRLSVLAMRSGFSITGDKFTPGLTVETFDNDKFTGTPIATKTQMTANVGTSMLGNADMMEMINNITADQMMAIMNQSGARRFDRWTGYYFARASGSHVVFVENQGQYRLTIDGQTVIDHVEIPKSALATTKLVLTPGPHKVVLETLTPPQFGEAVIKIGIVQEGTFVNQSAIDIAKLADEVIVCVGYDADIETEGADREFQLPPGQDELIEKIVEANPKTIVAITAGGAVDASRWIDKVAGLLHNWYPGEEGGTALAEVIFGDTNPSGRLPISWERDLKDNPSTPYYYPTPGTLSIPYKDDVFVGYRGYEHNGVKPLFPFGFGLSYTSFKYSELKIQPGAGAGAYEVSFDVTNTGSRAGADVAQVYVSEDHPQVPRPPQELKGFARVALDPGQTRHVTVPLNARSFTWYDEKSAAWHADPGSFTVHVSRSSADQQLEGKINLEQGIVLPVKQ